MVYLDHVLPKINFTANPVISGAIYRGLFPRTFPLDAASPPVRQRAFVWALRGIRQLGTTMR